MLNPSFFQPRDIRRLFEWVIKLDVTEEVLKIQEEKPFYTPPPLGRHQLDQLPLSSIPLLQGSPLSLLFYSFSLLMSNQFSLILVGFMIDLKAKG